MTWDKFLDLFRRKYLGEARLSGKVREFMELKQGKMSVAEYTARFDELARFVPLIVPTDDARRMKYKHGLSIDIVKQVDSGETGPRSYADTVQQALRIDGWDKKVEKSQTAKTDTRADDRVVVPFRGSKGHFQKKKGRFQRSNTRKFQGKSMGRSFSENKGSERDERRENKRSQEQNSGRFVKGHQSSNQAIQGSSTLIFPQCKKCGRPHSGECMAGVRGCYLCGQEGHYAKDCRNVKKEVAPTTRPVRPNARVYSLCEGEVEAGPSTVVTGQLPVANLSLFTLIDSGATHSFIASKIADKLEWKKECLAYPFITVTSAGDVYKSHNWFKDVPVKIGN